MRKNAFRIGCAVLALTPLQALAESMEACMKAKVAELREVKTEPVISDQGCTTSGTEAVLEWNYQGFRAHTCEAQVCYPAPKGRVITDAKAASRSAAGSNNGWNGPHYSPDRDRASAVCFNVWARGPDKDLNARGWQKLDVIVSTQRVFSDDELIGMASTCAAKIAKQ
ncbi:hypothetical protein [Achromobacter sp. PAB15]|uniref:hypothetical protein n=1 Tax=Achromobacter sp. PAB15 TaxID=3233048 RepID=UPI003F935D5C